MGGFWGTHGYSPLSISVLLLHSKNEFYHESKALQHVKQKLCISFAQSNLIRFALERETLRVMKKSFC